MYVNRFLLSAELSRKEAATRGRERELIARFLLSVENLRMRTRSNKNNSRGASE